MRLLFLGDSITDCSHCFDKDNLGFGYVRKIFEKLVRNDPELNMENRGIDGFTAARVYDLWQNLSQKERYDIVTVLVGINDVGIWTDQNYPSHTLNQFRLDFIQTYADLASDILDYGIPKILLLEPFIFSHPVKYRLWEPFQQQMSDDIRHIADQYHLTFVPLQEKLSDACRRLGYPAITSDGIHLTEKGSALLADIWMEASGL